MAEGIKKSDLIEGGAIDSIKADLDALANSLESTDNHFKSIAKTLKSDINPVLDKTSKGIREINEAEIKSEKLLREKLINEKKLSDVKIAQERLVQAELRTKTANNREAERQAKITERNNKLTRDEIILNDKNAGTLDKLAAKNRILSKERRTLNLETEKGRKRLQQINSELNRNNAIIEKNSDKLTKQRIGIGRYGKAISGLRSGLAKLGVAFGAAFVIRDVFSVVKDFEQAQADLASILAVNVSEMTALTEQAKALGATTTFTASQVSELQKELAKLGFTQTQIEDMTVGVLALAEATGSDLAQSAEVAGSVINAFGLDAKDSGEVVDIMAKSFSSSSLDMQKFSVAMASVAPVAKTMGFNLAQTTAMLGTLTDSGLDASTAGTSLRNMMLEANKAGLTWQEALDKVNNSQDKAGTSLELFGKRGVAAGVILAENQDKVAGLTDKLNDSTGAAEEMATVQRDTLGGALKEIRSAWEGWILDANGATGASEKLKNMIKFLAQNFTTIMTVLGKLTVAFATFKTVMFALKLKDQYNDWKKLGKGVENAAGGMDEASKSAKGFGNALKGIGITALIALVFELGKAWFNAASGAATYLKFQQAIENAKTKQGANAQARVDARDKAFNDEVNQIKLLRSQGKISATVETKRIKDLTDARKRDSDNDIKAIRVRKTKYVEELKAAKKLRQAFFDRFGGETAARSTAATLMMTGAAAGAMMATELEKYDAAVRKLGEQVEGAGAKIVVYKGENVDLSQSVVELTIAQNELNAGFDNVPGAIEKTKEAVIELDESYKDLEETIRSLESAQVASQIDGVSTNIEDELQSQIDIAIETGNFQKDLFINLIKDKFDLRVRDSEDIRDFEKMKAERDITDAQLLAVELERIEFEHQERLKAASIEGRTERNQGLEQLNEAQLQYFENKANKEIETEKDKNEEIFDAYRNLQEALTQVLTEQIDARIAQLDKESDAAKSQQDYFEALAANGNITAQQSIAEMIEIQREAEQEQARLAKVKQNIEMISAGLKTFTAEIEAGKSPAQALATTLTTTQVLASILGNFNFFAKGTDNAPEGWAVVDEQGAEIIKDKAGNIKDMGTGKGARFKYLEKGDKVVTASKSNALLSKFDQIGMGSIVKGAQDSAGNSYDLMVLNETMQGMSNKMDKMQTQINVDWQGLAGGMARVNVHTTKGGDKRTERYNIR